MPNVRGQITGRGFYSDDETRQDYQNYSQKQHDNTWKQRLDEEFEYRMVLEKKFNMQNDAEREKAAAAFAKYQANLTRKYAAEQDRKDRETRRKALEEERKYGDADNKRKKEIAKEIAALNKQDWKEDRQDKAREEKEQILLRGIENAVAAVGKAIGQLNQKVDNYIGVYNQYVSGITTRLQGSTKTFDSIADTITGKLAASPFVKQTEVLEKLNELVSAGISYNVEQRAFLAAMTDKMVTTFDAADLTLLRIIRLQQADSTIARMGMESILNKYLNAAYQDTAYLTDVYNRVESSLVDAISQLSVSEGTEFEYVVQKWLGSLYSVGMSESTLTEIAEGINYLASGNVQALSSNSPLQNLLVMGANTAGLNYAQMLTESISINDLNKLFTGIVQYAQGLADTDNLVVKNQYAQLFGLTMSDMTALLQMGEDLSYVIEQELSYANAIQETKNQLKTVGSRMPVSELIENVVDNVMFSAAKGIGESAGTYITWLVTNIVEEATGGINIPSIGAFVMGNGVNLDLETTVTQLMKTGIIGFSLLGQIGNIINGLSSGGALSLEGWGATDYTARGTGFTGIKTGSQQTTSQSIAVGNSGGEDIASGSITQAQNEATSSIGGQEQGTDSAEEIRENVATITKILQSVFDDGNALRVKVLNYGLTYGTSTNPNTSGM